MQSLIDILTFKSFISPYVLNIFYYMGAVAIPVGSWFFAQRIKDKYWLVSDGMQTAKALSRKLSTSRDRARLTALFLVMLLLMELFWRVLFEFIIAYFQMREALISLTT